MLIVFFGICGIFLAFLFSNTTQKCDSSSNSINFKLLLKACFDDFDLASSLVIKEKQKDITISDEEAAGKALNQLLSEDRITRNKIYRGN